MVAGISNIFTNLKKHKNWLISIAIILVGIFLILFLFSSLSEKESLENDTFNVSEVKENNNLKKTDTTDSTSVDGRMDEPILGKKVSNSSSKLNNGFSKFNNSNSLTCSDTESVKSYTDYVGTTSGSSNWYSRNEDGDHVTNVEGDYTDECTTSRELREYYCDEEDNHVTYELVNCYTEYGSDYRCETGNCVGGYYDLELGSFYAVPNPGTQSIYVLFDVNVEGNYTGDELVSVGNYWIQSTGEMYFVDPIEGTNLRLMGQGSFISIEGTFNLGSDYAHVMEQGYIDLTISIDSSDNTYELDETNNQRTERVFFN